MKNKKTDRIEFFNNNLRKNQQMKVIILSKKKSHQMRYSKCNMSLNNKKNN